MSLKQIEIWSEELKKRGIRTFEFKDLPENLKDRTMIIKAKYAGVIKKLKLAPKKSNGSSIRIIWEVT